MEKSRDSREALLEAARTVFARRGFDGATVKELADEAGVNVSLVSYYFDGKDGLYQACIEEAGRGRLAVAERILKQPESYEEFRVRTTMFIEEFFDFHLREKEFCEIMSRECMGNKPVTREVFRNTFLKAGEKLQAFFEAARKIGVVREDVDPQVMTYLVFGALRSAIQFEPISKEFYGKSMETDRKFRESIMKHILENLIGGFLNPKPAAPGARSSKASSSKDTP